MSRRALLLLIVVGLGAVCAGALLSQREKASAVRSLFPHEGLGAWERIALYIGVDIYPDDSIKNLAAPLNDIEQLREILRERYGFLRDAVVTGRYATRAGIGEALSALIAQVREARARDVSPVVMLFFGGHGSLVADDDEPDEPVRGSGPGYDSTWVAYDSNRMASNDIRDDDVSRVFGELDRLGATVVYLSDSCHSGTSYRGGDVDEVGVRGVTRRRLFRGPESTLFPGLPWRPRVRLASFTACHDVQLAQERRPSDMGGRVMGCFTYSALNVLKEADETLTYAAFGERALRRFRRDWPESITRHQQPQFAIDPALRDRPLFAPR